MASTPAVGPSPTTRTNTVPTPVPGTLRNTIMSQRSACSGSQARAAVRPDSVEIDDNGGEQCQRNRKDQGKAHAHSRHGDRTPGILRDQDEEVPVRRGRQEAAINLALTLRLAGSSITHGLNSVATSMGHSTTSTTKEPDSLRTQAGSLAGGRRRLLRISMTVICK